MSAALTPIIALLLLGIGCDTIEGRSPLRTLWKIPVAQQVGGSGTRPVVAAGHLYLAGQGVLALNPETGDQLWSNKTNLGTRPGAVAVSGQTVFAAGELAIALDAATGRELWRMTPASNASLGVPAADADAFYFGTDRGRLYALDVRDGSVRWTMDVSAGWMRGYVKGMAVSGDVVYANVERYYSENGFFSTGVVVALDRLTGREIWRYHNGDGSDSRNAMDVPVVSDNRVLLADSKSGAFIGLDRSTGQEVWRVVTGAAFAGPLQAPVVAGVVAYATVPDTYDYAIDVATGRVVWKRVPVPNGSGTRHAVCGGALMTAHDALYASRLSDGAPLGSLLTGGTDDNITSGLAVEGNRVFFVTNEHVMAVRCPS